MPRCRALLLAGLLALAVLPAAALAAPATPPTGPGSPAPLTAPTTTQAATTSNVTNVTNNNVILPAMPSVEDFAGGIFTQVLTLLLAGLADALQALLGQALGGDGPGGGGFVTSTPPAVTYAAPAVQSLWNTVRLAADASLGLIVAYAGALIALGKARRSPYDEALALVPRVGLALALANASLWLGQQAIALNNALCAAVGAGLPSFAPAAMASPTLADTLARLGYLVAGLLLVLQMLMRLGLVDVLLVLAPAGIVLYLLPGTRGWGEKWSALFVAAVFTQAIQVVALRLGTALLAGSPDGLLGFVTGIAVLVLVLRIPAMVGGYAQHHLAAAILVAGAVRGGAGKLADAAGKALGR